MPVTTYPSPLKVGKNRDPKVITANGILERVSRAWCNPSKWADSTNKRSGPEDRRVLQTSFSEHLDGDLIIPYSNGFVHGILRAFNQDLHLVLRPDDVWLAILTQFNFFVNGKAEILRPQFVSHEEKRNLTVDMTPFLLDSIVMGKFAQEMTSLIQKNVKDPELKRWIIPDFSTTNNNDRSVASIVMMGTFQAYFEYLMLCGCGFPSVTLLGEKSDWESIRTRLDRLPQYHAETADWAKILIPTIDHMVHTFDEPESHKVKDFWMHAAFEAGSEGSGRGITTLSGWITAFCFWGDNGERISDRTERCPRYDCWGVTMEQRRPLVLNGVSFPLIGPRDIPSGFVTVPLTVKDYFEKVDLKTTMVAGLVGVTLISKKEGDTVQPRTGWWMLEDGREKMGDSDTFLQKRSGSETTSGAGMLTESSVDDFNDCDFNTA